MGVYGAASGECTGKMGLKSTKVTWIVAKRLSGELPVAEARCPRFAPFGWANLGLVEGYHPNPLRSGMFCYPGTRRNQMEAISIAKYLSCSQLAYDQKVVDTNPRSAHHSY